MDRERQGVSYGVLLGRGIERLTVAMRVATRGAPDGQRTSWCLLRKDRKSAM